MSHLTSLPETLLYMVHIQNKGWSPWHQEGQFAGTEGESLQLEAIRIKGVDMYRVYMENIGWGPWTENGEIAGTVGKGLRIESIEIRGKDVNYHVHVQNYGWMNWVKDGEITGTQGGALRIEAIQIVKSKDSLNVDTHTSNVKIEPKPKPQPQPQPTNQLAGKTIVVDAGHGGSDGGAVSTMKESDMNLTVALKLGKVLAEHGARVIQTRTTDRHMYLSERVKIANDANATIFVSIHHNGASSPDAHGSETICHPGSTNGLRLADLTLNGITNRLKTYRRRIIQRDDYTVTYTHMPAVITEALFVSNPNDIRLFQNGGADLEVQGILDGILTYFK